MNEAKEEIRARLPVEDVVGQYVELKRAGRNLKGRSPWGVDKTPSFMVSPEKGIWHDFSANKGGDIFTFLMEVEGISFKEALERLAAQAGVQLPKYSGGDKKVAAKKARVRECLELVTRYYQVCLAKNKTVCEYVFYKRGLTRETIKKFRIGYAPKGNFAVEFLTKRGFSKEEMAEAGLLNRFETDLFKGRMMVPFMGESKREVIGFTGRVLDKSEPKYLNTPETLLFNKSRFIFGLNHAKEAIRKNGFVVIVEGNMDVISSHQAGVQEAVATSGTAMTEAHLKMLARLTTDIRLAYDGDAAGMKAAERAIGLAEKVGVNLRVVADYYGAKDPDELIQKDAKLWQKAVAESVPAVEWLLDKYEEQGDLMSGPGKKEYSNKAMAVIRGVKDAVERKHYEQVVARRLGVEVEDLLSKKVEFRATRLKKVKEQKQEQKWQSLRNLQDRLEAILLYGGAVAEKIKLEVPEDEVRVKELELVFEKFYKNMGEGELAIEIDELWRRYLEERKRLKLAEMAAELEDADEERTKEILREMMRVRGE